MPIMVTEYIVSVLRCVTVCYGVLQCIAVCCRVLQCVAVCCSDILLIIDIMQSVLYVCCSVYIEARERQYSAT